MKNEHGVLQNLKADYEGAKALHDSKSQTAGSINKMVEMQDKQTNDLNNKLLSAHQELTAVLSTPSAVYNQDLASLVGGTATAGFQGYSIGKQLDASNATIAAAKGAST